MTKTFDSEAAHKELRRNLERVITKCALLPDGDINLPTVMRSLASLSAKTLVLFSDHHPDHPDRTVFLNEFVEIIRAEWEGYDEVRKKKAKQRPKLRLVP